MRRCLTGVLLLLCLAWMGTGQVAARTPIADPVLPLGGLWKGKLSVLGGQLDLTISVVPLASGKFFAALDVPAQKVSRMVTEMTVRGDSVLLWMPDAGTRYNARFDASKRELNGTWMQAGVKSPLRLYYFPMPTVTGPGTRLAPPYREEDVTFNNPVGRLNLAGTLTVPPGPGPFPAVVLVSDIGAQDRDGTLDDYHMMGSLADYLTRRGIAVLRYDDRGVGKSGGNSKTATTAMLVSDVQAALNFLRARLEINIARIGVIGHGEGANVALLAAGEPLPPAFVVSLAGYGLTGVQTLLQQQVAQDRAKKKDPVAIQAAYERQRTMYDIIGHTNAPQALAIVSNMLRQDQPTLDPKAAEAQAAELLTPWRHYFLSFDPIEGLDQVHCPVLLLSGTDDAEAPAELHLTALEKELRSITHAITVKRLAGVNHLFQPPKTEWTLMNGEMKPLFSPVAEEVIREWITGLYAVKPTKELPTSRK
ncbi:alpha/beta hydrolase family protein [Hymenobacter rubidus]|uniref:alpha/beta hydrolase family protein n=1 Tax=Hymenobacter rubidus TaxID=1441626 RepID=UPI00191CCDAB|nr:alpha/beta hydrolase [Hymenobacter rubidus]